MAATINKPQKPCGVNTASENDSANEERIGRSIDKQTKTARHNLMKMLTIVLPD